MSTHGEIQKFVQRHHGFIPKPEWITHVKVVWGLPTRQAPNRAGRGRRVVPLPPEKREAIEEALRHFGLKPSPAGTPRPTTLQPSVWMSKHAGSTRVLP
jgi:hypothetical protein